MKNKELEKVICAACGEQHKTLDDYIAVAEKFGITLSVEDLLEIERVIKEKEAKCKENSSNHA